MSVRYLLSIASIGLIIASFLSIEALASSGDILDDPTLLPPKIVVSEALGPLLTKAISGDQASELLLGSAFFEGVFDGKSCTKDNTAAGYWLKRAVNEIPDSPVFHSAENNLLTWVNAYNLLGVWCEANKDNKKALEYYGYGAEIFESAAAEGDSHIVLDNHKRLSKELTLPTK